jgi:hypothetical protein
VVKEIEDALNPYPIRLKFITYISSSGNGYGILNIVDKNRKNLSYLNDLLLNHFQDYKGGFGQAHIRVDNIEQINDVVNLYNYFATIDLSVILSVDKTTYYVNMNNPEEINNVLVDLKGVLKYGYLKYSRTKKVELALL